MPYTAQNAVDEAKVLLQRFNSPQIMSDMQFLSIARAIARTLLDARAKQANEDGKTDAADWLKTQKNSI
jgi:hypothetical protein